MGQSFGRDRPVTTIILVAGVILQVFLVLAHGVNKELLGDGAFLAIDQDASLPSWATVVLYAFAGVSCGLLAWLRPQWRAPLAVLAVFALGLSLEQTVQVHGDVESDSENPLGTLSQTIGGAIFAASLFFAARVVPRPFRWFFLLAIATIATAAGASEMNDKLDLPYAGVIFFQTLEEVGEMLTAILILAATAEPLLAALRERLLEEEEEEAELSAPRRTREPEGATPPPAR